MGEYVLMSFERPTLTQLVDRISSDFKTRITGASTLVRRATLKAIARTLAGAFHLMYGFVNYISEQLFAASADQTYLDLIASEYGIIRIAATKATGSGSVTGTNALIVTEDSVLQSADGYRYLVTADATIAGGTATVAFEAEEAGADSNDDPSVALTFVSPIAGISSTLAVDAIGISGGADEETDDAMRERVLARKRNPPHGGAEQDYVNWAKEVAGVTRAWVFSEYAGAGTVGLAFVRDEDAATILPDASERLAVYNYILEHEDPGTGLTVGIPVTAEPGFEIIVMSGLTIDFQIDIYPNISAIQAAVQSELEDLIERDGGPGETIYISQIRQAISSALDEDYHRLDSPVADVTASTSQVQVMGTITWGDY